MADDNNKPGQPGQSNEPDKSDKKAGSTQDEGASKAVVTPPPAAQKAIPKADAPKTEASKTDKAPSAKSATGRTIGITAAVTLIAVAAAGYYWKGDLARFVSPADPAQIAALEARLAALEAAEAENDAVARALADDLARRGAEVGALADTVSGLEAGSSADVASDLAAARTMMRTLEARMDEFEAQTGEQSPMVTGDLNPGQQVGQSAVQAADLDDMKSALAGLSQRFSSLDETLADSEGRIDALEQVAPPEGLEDILSNLSPRKEVDSLGQRLQSVEDANPAEAARVAVVALSATELARAASTSAPFVRELEAFVVLSPEISISRDLNAWAVSGIATEKTLLLQFPGVAHAVSEAERIRQGGGFWNWLVNSFTSLFSIRKVGEVDGDDWQAILARAENRIAVEDINAAASELAKLTGPAAVAAAPWTGAVAARQGLDSQIGALTTSVFSDLLTVLEER